MFEAAKEREGGWHSLVKLLPRGRQRLIRRFGLRRGQFPVIGFV